MYSGVDTNAERDILPPIRCPLSRMINTKKIYELGAAEYLHDTKMFLPTAVYRVENFRIYTSPQYITLHHHNTTYAFAAVDMRWLQELSVLLEPYVASICVLDGPNHYEVSSETPDPNIVSAIRRSIKASLDANPEFVVYVTASNVQGLLREECRLGLRSISTDPTYATCLVLVVDNTTESEFEYVTVPSADCNNVMAMFKFGNHMKVVVQLVPRVDYMAIFHCARLLTKCKRKECKDVDCCARAQASSFVKRLLWENIIALA